jgi:uncharacterized cupin superfamily protein
MQETYKCNTLSGIKSRITKRPKTQDPNSKTQDHLNVSAWNLELGIWSLEFGAWNLEFNECGNLSRFQCNSLFPSCQRSEYAHYA